MAETLTDLTPTAQTALRAIKSLRKYDLPESAKAERTILAKLSSAELTAVILALESESQTSLSPTERVNRILDRLVQSAQITLQANTEKIIQMRTANPELELTVDPKQVLTELELRYKNRTRDFIRALVHAGLSENVIAGLWPIFDRSDRNPDRIIRDIRRLGGTMMLTSSKVDRFELSDTDAVLAHIEATFDNLEIVDIETLPTDTYRVKVESRDAVMKYLRESGVLDCPEIDVCLTAVSGGFVIDLTALEVHPVQTPIPNPADAKEIAIAVVKRWKYSNRTEEEADTGLTEDQLTRKLETAIRSGAMGPQTSERFEQLVGVAQSLLQTVPADVLKSRWLERVTDFSLGSDETVTFEQVLQSGEELKTVLDYWKILK